MGQAIANKRIMLVDDDSLTNMINKKILGDVNFLISEYTDARETLSDLKALVSLPEAIPDIIFLDINMPAMDGWEFLEEFQKFPESVLLKCKVFMLTSSIDQDDFEKSKKYTSIRAFISKPLTVEKVRALFAE